MNYWVFFLNNTHDLPTYLDDFDSLKISEFSSLFRSNLYFKTVKIRKGDTVRRSKMNLWFFFLNNTHNS